MTEDTAIHDEAIAAGSAGGVGPLTQEVRLATTMTGGVSLAIWMGGVARELNVLMQASRWRRGGRRPEPVSPAPLALLELYFELIEFLDILVDVDVQSGTSAGGINSVLLSYCRANDKDMGSLRDIWLDLGAMEDLLRKPTDQSLPSLMYGDAKMLAGLHAALDQLERSDANLPEPLEVTVGGMVLSQDTGPSSTLYVTTTLLEGEIGRFTDSFGTLVQDANLHGVFTFGRADLADPAVKGALALAGRSTASFPGAFEPSFLPSATASPKIGAVAARDAVGRYLATTRPHWAADGGLLDNEPLDLVLERVFDTRAVRPVRRVLLYVVPSSGPDPASLAAGPFLDPGQPLGLVDALLKDLSAATSQSIATDLRAIRDHNDQVVARADTRLQLTVMASRLAPGERLLSRTALDTYIERAAAHSAQPLIDGFIRQIAAGPSWLPPAWAAELAPGGAAEKIVSSAMRDTLEKAWGRPILPALPTLPIDTAGYAGYGRPAWDVAKAVALAVVGAAFAAASSDEERMHVMAGRIRVHNAAQPPARTSSMTVQAELTNAYKPKLSDPTESLHDAATRIAEAYLERTEISSSGWVELGDAVLSVLETVRASDGPLSVYRSYLVAAGADKAHVAGQLFDLATAERALLPPDISPDQLVELIQISADTRSLLASATGNSAHTKLTGMQFHHFGAFYKRSWRANDWMWGRVDGAGWLVHVLLDPRRLAARTETEPVGNRAAFVLAELGQIAGGRPEPGTNAGQAAAINVELAYLDSPGMAVPDSLPSTALWVARAFQALVAQEELPQLADDVLGDGKNTDWSPAASRRWAEQVKATPLSELASKLASCEVQKETFATDRGSPLMARTLSKALATTTGALATADQLPVGIRSVVGTVRTVTVSGYRVVSAVRGVAARAIFVGAALLLIGIVLAAQSSALLGFSGLAIAAAGAYVVIFATWQLSGRLFGAIVGFTVTAAIGSLAIEPERRWLFGTKATDGGWVGRNVHWLSGSWWRPLIVVLAVVVAITLDAVVVSAVRRWLLRKIHKPVR